MGMPRFWSFCKLEYMTMGCFWTHIVNTSNSKARERVTTWLRADLDSVCWYLQFSALIHYVTTGCFWTHIVNIMKLEKGWLRDYLLIWRVNAYIYNIVQGWLHDYGLFLNACSENFTLGSLRKGDYVATVWFCECMSKISIYFKCVWSWILFSVKYECTIASNMLGVSRAKLRLVIIIFWSLFRYIHPFCTF